MEKFHKTAVFLMAEWMSPLPKSVGLYKSLRVKQINAPLDHVRAFPIILKANASR